MSFKLIIYNTECLNLARSILLKSDLMARCVEYSLVGSDSYLETPRDTWKYYLNISGTYHASNEVMYITSLDTLTRIEFTKDVLVDHPLTSGKYTANSELTEELIALYPDNHFLIMGIIYSIDIDTCIDAEEFTILAYDTSLVGVQEINLISGLQNRLYADFNSNVNLGYAQLEPSYAIPVLSSAAKQILKYIKVIRLSNYKTTRACDYYVWTYINSKLYLEDLKDSLTRDDIFFLYKNIKRLTDSAGSNTVLYELIDQFLNSSTITTYRLSAVKNTNNISGINSSLDIEYVESAINSDVVDRTTSIDGYVEQGNEDSNRVIPNYADSFEARMYRSTDNVKTNELKVFEVVTDTTDTQILLFDLDIHIDGVVNGWYNDTHSIGNHVNGQVYNLSSYEAVILYMYLVRKRGNVDIGIIPPHTIYRVPRSVLPTATYLSETYDITMDTAEKILDALPAYPTSAFTRTDIDTYINATKTAYNNVLRLVRGVTVKSNQLKLLGIYHELYFTGDVELVGEGVTFDAWLSQRGLDFSSFEDLDYDIIETTLLLDVFNVDLTARTSKYAVSITEVVNRLNNYRVNLRAEAGSDNLVDMHISPMYIDSGRPLINMLYDTPTVGIDVTSSWVTGKGKKYTELSSYIDVVRPEVISTSLGFKASNITISSITPMNEDN